MKIIEKYKFGFDVWGLMLFLVVMIHNFIWFAVPAPNDILRAESVTQEIDTVGSIFQVIFVAALCVLVHRERGSLRLSPLVMLSAGCVVLYDIGWGMYYGGLTSPLVMSLLTLPPCLAFIFFALDRKNGIAAFFAACFTVCHVIYGAVNFIL